MICPKCSYTLTLLFTSTACDRCDGLLPKEAVTAGLKTGFSIGDRVRYKPTPKYTGIVTAFGYDDGDDTCQVSWDAIGSSYHSVHELTKE
jgi:hypothetical protein